MKRIRLKVPFEEKEEAKELGAKWDHKEKAWFVPQGLDPQPFRRWLHKNWGYNYDMEGITKDLLPLLEKLRRLYVEESYSTETMLDASEMFRRELDSEDHHKTPLKEMRFVITEKLKSYAAIGGVYLITDIYDYLAENHSYHMADSMSFCATGIESWNP